MRDREPFSFFAVFNKHGLVKTTKRQPEVRPGEIPLELHFDFPESAFQDNFIHATVKVPEEVVMLPTPIISCKPIKVPQEDGQ
ncbi:hypothetical protein [Alterisphingorhabdus coralli]|uniref:Uncharacterized protein n=1 Tax=Alterisphingorhabdus coralli TaxID=3071408 RepID=A0AA97I2K8_9SPHN|nr:hypothetical protein [Parasphingorhabdus sp. SCSIO 66989]WOE76353.1 hypothetical protein RB602_06470 [Parasphingorhabdus sp. SCSIO 66989]